MAYKGFSPYDRNDKGKTLSEKELTEVRRGDIRWIRNPMSATGAEIGKTRPAIIVSNDENNKNYETVEIVYLTTNERYKSDYHLTLESSQAGEAKGSTALCEQVFTVCKDRVGNLLGKMGSAEMLLVEERILKGLAIEIPVANNDAQIKLFPQFDEPEDYAAVKCERDFYKREYENLLDRLLVTKAV
jgi:mRNA interferase MazF